MGKILLIDDDKDFVDINKSLLAKEGHTILASYNAADGYAQMNRERPDVVILDVMMDEPDDGFALAQKIRRDGNQVPIIMLTSVGKVTGMEFDKDSDMVPVNEFLEKPVAAATLVAAVRKYLKE